MPSFSTIVKSLALAALFNSASAAPTVNCGSKPTASAPTVPASGDTPDLPTTNLTLQFVAIGRGIQNYTCSAAGATGASIGAIATLFDATSLAFANITKLHTIPAEVVNNPTPAPGSPLMTSAGPFKVLGNHYFDSILTPTFNLSTVSKVLFGAKSADVKAPADASVGPAGTGAVDWLQLTAKPAPYVSVGLALAYRVETAGGNAVACTDAGVITTEYAAEYWFYN